MAYFASRTLTRSAPLLLTAALLPTFHVHSKPDRLDSKPSTRHVASGFQKPLGKAQDIWTTTPGDLPQNLLRFIDESPSPYHAVDNAKSLLESKGFREVREDQEWDLQQGGKYYVIRTNTSGASLTAFAIGKQWQPGNSFAIVATHVDSPCLRLKPISARSGHGYLQVGVELYGGGLWHTWFDRDLGLAGRVMVRTGPDTIETRLVKLREPLLHIPTLAVHYQRQNPFEFELESKLVPLLATRETASREEGKDSYKEDGQQAPEGEMPSDTDRRYWPANASRRTHTSIVDRVADHLGVSPGLVVDLDLCLFDVQESALGGIHQEFIYASRLDNLMMTFCGLVGFTRSVDSASALDDESAVRVLTLFDHEEISSKSSLGALSPFLPHVLQRICKSSALSSETAVEQSMSRSFLLSADQTHALHPQHPRWHEENHQPMINQGLVVSSHPRNTFMRNTPGTVLLREILCRAYDLTEDGEAPKTQLFTTPNGVSCGSTLGPLLGTQTGIRTLDVGNSQLSMHSTREMAGAFDIANAVAILQGFWRDFAAVDKTIKLS